MDHGLLRKTPKIHRHHLAHTRLLHGNSVDNVHGGHGALVVGNHDELRLLAELADGMVELADVGIVQRGIHLIQHAEGRGL